MSHEYTPTPTSPEHEPYPDRITSIFDLERMAPEEVGDLFAALGMATRRAIDEANGGNSPKQDRFDALFQRAGNDAKRLVATDLEKANELFMTLAKYPDEWVRELALDYMAVDLLRYQPDDTTARRALIDQWVHLLDAEGELVEPDPDDLGVQEAASRTMSKVVHSDWLDERTARYLDSKLRAEYQREEWWTE